MSTNGIKYKLWTAIYYNLIHISLPHQIYHWVKVGQFIFTYFLLYILRTFD